MSDKRQAGQCDVEVEQYDVFAATLKKVMDTPKDKRGPAGRAIMAAFQVYYEQIAAAPTKGQEETR